MSRLFVPGQKPPPTPHEQRAAALAAELAVGRLALRCLSVLLAEKEGRKTAVRKDRIEKVRAKYPGAVIRFGEEAERITLRLMTPAELDAADQEVASRDAERKKLLEQEARGEAAPA